MAISSGIFNRGKQPVRARVASHSFAPRGNNWTRDIMNSITPNQGTGKHLRPNCGFNPYHKRLLLPQAFECKTARFNLHHEPRWCNHIGLYYIDKNSLVFLSLKPYKRSKPPKPIRPDRLSVQSGNIDLSGCFYMLPVVIRADLIAAGDHVGWNDLT
ncbi:hypothetical protein OSB04_028294 [Centaurea solstitialis]|uniref:Uncharacterized protein n=1 Tax=Centaurea solstitialis TaxID=347529 RepID=A0AA38SMV2_9ASTR|nr:hypothetical protein OSB04_028294 [Centaurea solstitialis]